MNTSSASRAGNNRRLARVSSVAAFFAVSVLALSRPVHASPEYPADIKAYWGHLTSLPVPGMGCKLCHSSDDGQTGTVVQPFGKTMKAQGLKPENPQSLYAALYYVGQHSVLQPIVDSDGDGVPDYTEVAIDHTNPNDRGDFKQKPKGGGDIPSNGGAGGDTGGAESADAGGQGSGQEPPLPPMLAPPSAGDLPPPFVHGCATAPPARDGTPSFIALLAASAIARRRGRKVER